MTRNYSITKNSDLIAISSEVDDGEIDLTVYVPPCIIIYYRFWINSNN